MSKRRREKREIWPINSHILDGEYEIVNHIKVGSGMSNVYLVRDVSLGKLWCLKEIRLSEEPSKREKLEYASLLREAEIMRDLNNQNIPRIVTIKKSDDGRSTFIVMDYIEGMTVSNWIESKGMLDQKLAIPWMKNICSVLIYLHARENPIIYRDMKPSNIMISDTMSAMLIDFGISEVISPDNQVIKESLGTPGFAAPEQRLKGSPYDLRSDIFGFGRTFYAMLTGLNVLPKDTPSRELPDLKERVPSVTPGLYNIIYKCMEDDANKRYQSADELLVALENIDKQDEVYKNKLRRKKNLFLLSAFASVFLLIMSSVPRILSKKQEAEDYNNLVVVAEQSGKAEDYEAAIEKQPKVLDPYFGYITAIKQDGEFTKEEENKLLNLINPVLLDVKGDSKYGDLAYEIGRLYWFYYNDTLNNKMIQSVNWFKDAVDNGSNVEKAQILYNLGAFKRDISENIRESDDSGKYIEYWKALMEAKEGNTGEILEIQVNNAIIDAIGSYAYRIGKDGVPFDDIKAELDRIQTYLNNTTPSEGVASEMFEDLREAYETVSVNAERDYNGGVTK